MPARYRCSAALASALLDVRIGQTFPRQAAKCLIVQAHPHAWPRRAARTFGRPRTAPAPRRNGVAWRATQHNPAARGQAHLVQDHFGMLVDEPLVNVNGRLEGRPCFVPARCAGQSDMNASHLTLEIRVVEVRAAMAGAAPRPKKAPTPPRIARRDSIQYQAG